jgi:CRISPR/Cas system endoribonuclease Cas6 (RAMP superfamily)
MKLKSFCKAKDIVNGTNLKTTNWEKNFTIPTPDRGLISKIYKELKKLTIKKNQTTQSKNGILKSTENSQ